MSSLPSNNDTNHGSDRSGSSPLTSADNVFNKATELHQQGEIFQALNLYSQILKRFPTHPKADIMRTLISGLQNEKIDIFWNTALDARSQCNPDEAIKLYNVIIEEFPESHEAQRAVIEIKNISEIMQAWNAALGFQSQGNESKALDLYKHIVEQFPQSPEAENAGLLTSIIHQNQFISTREVTYDLKKEESTPEKIVSHLLAHKKTTSGNATDLSPEAKSGEAQRKKIDKLWAQAVALDKDGNIDVAAILYRQIIDTSLDGHRVRDAKYRLDKIEAVTTGDFVLMEKKTDQSGLLRGAARAVSKTVRNNKLLAAIVILCIMALAGAALFYKTNKPASWTDAVENAKKSIVVVKASTGPGTGFLVSADGQIITNAGVVGKDKDVEVRLYSGALKKAAVVKTGLKPLDIAVLKIDGIYDQFLAMAGSDECTEGEEIRGIGAPSGLEYFITKGIISHCNHDRDGVRYLQTDTAVNLGNSGGPCIDIQGKVIGLSTTIRLADSAQGLNLLLPMTVVKDFMDGKLVALEESLIRKEEEKARQLEQENNKFYADAEVTSRRLQHVADLEYANYTAKLDNLVRMHVITYDQGKSMAESVRYAPSGSTTTAQWIQSLALKVVKGDMTEDSAIKLIKAHVNH